MLWYFLRSTDSGVEKFFYTDSLSQNMSVGPSVGTQNIWMSHASISNSFNAAISSAILAESLDTTDDYVIKECVFVLCPLPTSLSFLRKFSPSLMSNIMQHLISWYPIGRSSLRFSQTSNAGHNEVGCQGCGVTVIVFHFTHLGVQNRIVICNANWPDICIFKYFQVFQIQVYLLLGLMSTPY